MGIEGGSATPAGGGMRTQLGFQNGLAGKQPAKLNAPPIQEGTEEVATSTSTVDGAPVLPYLTPDAMLVYCQTRLNDINTQCKDIMSRQEKNTKDQGALGELVKTLNRFQDGGDANGKATIDQAYDKAIAAVGGSNTELGAKLAIDRNTFFNKQEAPKNDVQACLSSTKSMQSQLNSDSEIDMIRMQSLMSQRQTAIQLTTNIIQSLNDQANKIVANIGH